jgi:hypothetical protein
MLLEEVIGHKEEEIDKGEYSSTEEDPAVEMEMFMRQWEKEFERLNPNPEENSDFDSDNEINPLDTLTPAGKYVSSK